MSEMGDILENINNAENGNPYIGSGEGNSNTLHTSENQPPLMGPPQILKHSYNGGKDKTVSGKP